MLQISSLSEVIGLFHQHFLRNGTEKIVNNIVKIGFPYIITKKTETEEEVSFYIRLHTCKKGYGDMFVCVWVHVFLCG